MPFFLSLAALAVLIYIWRVSRHLRDTRQALEDSEAYIERLVREIPVGVYELVEYPDGHIEFQFISDQAAELLGMDKAELLRDFTQVFNQFHPDDVEEARQKNEAARLARKPFQLDTRIVTDGKVRHVRITSLPRPAPHCVRWAGAVSDISELMEANQTVVERERLLAAMSRLSGCGAWQLDMATGEVRWTEEVFHIHELDPADQPDLSRAIEFYAPSDQAALEKAIERARTEHKGWDMTAQMTTAKGRRITCRSIGHPVVRAGRLERMVGAFQDITDVLKQHERLSEAEARFRGLFEKAPVGLMLHDGQTGGIIDANPAAWRLFGAEGRADLLARQKALWGSSPFSWSDAQQRVRAVIESGEQTFDWQIQHLDGRTLHVQVTLTRLQIDNRDCVLAACVDMTDRINAERLLREGDQRLLKVLQDVPGVAIQGYGLDGTVHYWNTASEKLYGYTQTEALGGNLLELIIPPEEREGVRQALETVAAGETIENGEIQMMTRDGQRVPVYSSHVVVHGLDDSVELYCVDFDLRARKRHEAELQHVANYDSLTGLPNRKKLSEVMDQRCKALQADNGFHLIYLDLDNFKPINDEFGHDIGDDVLRQVAERLRQHVEREEFAARLGGDEFVLLIDRVADETVFNARIQSLIDLIGQPIPFGKLDLRVKASIGVADFPTHSTDPDMLLRQADQAMYQAKSEGRNRFHRFDASSETRRRARQSVLEAIGRGMANSEFELHYQPKVDLHSGAVTGLEALVRWRHPDKGLVPPGSFIPVLGRSSLEIPFGEFVLDLALAQMERWTAGGKPLPLSINIAGRHLLWPEFTASFRQRLLNRPTVCPDLITLEVLESATLDDMDQAIQVIKTLRDLGVTVSLDDFGTGYSSLAYLRSLPVRELKIDRSFVADMLDDLQDFHIVRGVVGLARAFDLRLVAEGIETEGQLSALAELGCQQGQGFLFSPPLPADDLENWLDGWPTRAAAIDWGKRQQDEPTELQVAIKTHQHWLRRLHEAVQQGPSLANDLELSPTSCTLGQWLHGKGGQLLGPGSVNHQALVRSHQDLHSLGARLMADLQQQGAAPVQMLDDLDQKSRDLVSALRKAMNSSES